PATLPSRVTIAAPAPKSVAANPPAASPKRDSGLPALRLPPSETTASVAALAELLRAAILAAGYCAAPLAAAREPQSSSRKPRLRLATGLHNPAPSQAPASPSRSSCRCSMSLPADHNTAAQIHVTAE